MLWIVILVATFGLVADALNTRSARSRGLEIRGRTRAVALGATLWGLVTLLLFVPGGALLSLVMVDGGGAALILAIAVSALCVSGLAVAFDLLRAPRALAARDIPTLRRTARFIAYHHIGVMLIFAIGALVTGIKMFAVVLLCCALGELLAWMLMAAVSTIDIPAARALRRKV